MSGKMVTMGHCSKVEPLSQPRLRCGEISYHLVWCGKHFRECVGLQWEDETARERTGYLPSYAEAKKMKSLTVHTRGYHRASLRDCSSSYSSMSKNNTETKNGMKRTADGAPVLLQVTTCISELLQRTTSE